MSYLTRFIKKQFQPKQQGQTPEERLTTLDVILRSATRVQERRWFEDPFKTHADGQWTCCKLGCHKENPVIQYHGAHPFKFLKCNGCNHVMCKQCSPTSIIKVGLPSDTEPLCEDGPELIVSRIRGEVPYFKICKTCGLSRRAIKTSHLDLFLSYIKFDDAPCACCGTVPDEMSTKFSIGDNRGFRGRDQWLNESSTPPGASGSVRWTRHPRRGRVNGYVIVYHTEPQSEDRGSEEGRRSRASSDSKSSSLQRRGAVRHRTRPRPRPRPSPPRMRSDKLIPSKGSWYAHFT